MTRREMVGLGAAACAACCVGALFVAIGAVTSLGVVGTVFVGAGALGVSAVVIVVLLAAVHRRRGTS